MRFAGKLEPARPINARRGQHGVIIAAQAVERPIAADLALQNKPHPAFDQPVDAPGDDAFVQFEIRNAVGEEPTGPVVAVKDVCLIALAAEPFSGGEPGRPRADNGDAPRARRSRF